MVRYSVDASFRNSATLQGQTLFDIPKEDLSHGAQLQ